MKNAIFFATFFLVCIYGFGQTNSEEKSVIELSSRKFQWMTDHNYDSLSALLHNSVTYIHSNGWIQTKKEIIDDFRSGKLILRSIKVQTASAHLFNQTAIVNGEGKFEGEVSGTPFSLDLVYSEGYIKENGKWILISRLATKITK